MPGRAPDLVEAQARAALAEGRADLAIALLEPACSGAQATARAWQLLGFALREEQRMPEAIVAFEHAESIDRADALTATALAQTRLQCGLPALEAEDRELGSPQRVPHANREDPASGRGAVDDRRSYCERIALGVHTVKHGDRNARTGRLNPCGV